jgi:hypothetical protein
LTLAGLSNRKCHLFKILARNAWWPNKGHVLKKLESIQVVSDNSCFQMEPTRIFRRWAKSWKLLNLTHLAGSEAKFSCGLFRKRFNFNVKQYLCQKYFFHESQSVVLESRNGEVTDCCCL